LQSDPLYFEEEARRLGYRRVAGIDEAGRGPLAGPVVAAAVVLPAGCRIAQLTDSKKLTPKLRERLFDEIHARSLAVGIGVSDAGLIDRINILEATRRAMAAAIGRLDPPPDYLLIDAVRLACPTPQRNLVKGDLRSHSIAAASVIAKVTRDRMMDAYHADYPEYNFAKHKGYGTREHRLRIEAFGPSAIHRKTFRRVREFCGHQTS
jgi:ribonuclease HII